MFRLLLVGLLILPLVGIAEITFPYFQDFESPHSLDGWNSYQLIAYPAPSYGSWTRVQNSYGYFEQGYQRLQGMPPDYYAEGCIRLCSDAFRMNTGESLLILTHFTTVYSGTGASCNIGLLIKDDELNENPFWKKTVATQTETKPLDRVEYTPAIASSGYYRVFLEISAFKMSPGYQEFYFNLDDIKLKLLSPGKGITEVQQESLSKIKAMYK